MDPISLDPIAELPYPPFRIKVKSKTSGGNNTYHLFDGKFLAHYVVSTGTFIDPLSRQALTRADCERLDAYIREHNLGDVSVTDALRLSQATKKDAGEGVRAAALQNEARNVLNAMFEFTTSRNHGRGRQGDRERRQHQQDTEAGDNVTLMDRVMTELGGDGIEEEQFPSLGGGAPRSRGNTPPRARPAPALTGSRNNFEDEGAPRRAVTLASHLPDSWIAGGENATEYAAAGKHNKEQDNNRSRVSSSSPLHVGAWSAKVLNRGGYMPSGEAAPEDLGSLVRRALYDNEEAFLNFQLLCSKCAKYKITPEEYYSSISSMMNRQDLNHILPKLLETLTDKSIVKDIRRLHAADRRERGTAAERLFRAGAAKGSGNQPNPMSWNRVSMGAPSAPSKEHFPSFPSRPNRQQRKPFYHESSAAVAAGKAAKAAEEAKMRMASVSSIPGLKPMKPASGTSYNDNNQSGINNTQIEEQKKKKKKKKNKGWQKVPLARGRQQQPQRERASAWGSK